MDFSTNVQEFYKFLPKHLPIKTNPFRKEDIQIGTKFPPNDSQKEAIAVCMNNIISGIHGPPGTGKTQTIANLLEFFFQNSDSPKRVLVSAFSYHALQVIMDKIIETVYNDGSPSLVSTIQRIYVRGENRPALDISKADDYMIRKQTHRFNGRAMRQARQNLVSITPDDVIFFANPNQLHKLRNIGPDDYFFDLIIIDEASQMPVDQFLVPLDHINDIRLEIETDDSKELESVDYVKIPNNLIFDDLTKIVIVGDHFQLPPVQVIKPPEKLKKILGSLFSFYIHIHDIKHKQLNINYRSHPDIVDYTNNIGIYSDKIIPYRRVEDAQLDIDNFQEWSSYNPPSWIKKCLDPVNVVSTIIHSKFNYESAVSEIEGNIVADLILQIYLLLNPQSREDEFAFWNHQVGVVAPHNAQGQYIIQTVYDKIINTPLIASRLLSDEDLMRILQNIIVSVEKFQGSDREIILASVGISSKDQLYKEEDFIYDLNRFNVLTSRAKVKCIFVCSHNFLNYIPKDREILLYAGRIREYAYQFCDKEEKFTYTNQNSSLDQELIFRYH